MPHKWANPLEWLCDHIDECVLEEGLRTLANDFRILASRCDMDQIQDAFKYLMKADGYYEEEVPST